MFGLSSSVLFFDAIWDICGAIIAQYDFGVSCCIVKAVYLDMKPMLPLQRDYLALML